MRYSEAMVRAITGEAPAITSPVGVAGTRRDHDTLLWGQLSSLNNPLFDAGAEGGATVSQQVIRVMYERPTTWTLKTLLSAIQPAGETASLVFNWTITIGVGTVRMQLQRSHTFVGPAPGGLVTFEPVLEQFPAQAIQVDASVQLGSLGVITVGKHDFSFAAMVAPVFE